MPENSTWSIFGVGRGFLPMAMMGLIMGGHIRVGMEDNIYVNPGVLAKTNAELVERVMRICLAYGRGVATPAEARKILGFTK
jgi:3-keto-5-aminohexanoate cleavage enzyme